MKDSEKKRIVQGIECCLGLDSRRCEGCPWRRYHGREDGKCCERLMVSTLDAIRETMPEADA